MEVTKTTQREIAGCLDACRTNWRYFHQLRQACQENCDMYHKDKLAEWKLSASRTLGIDARVMASTYRQG